MGKVIIRPAEQVDRAFILDSAWRSIKEHPAAEDCTPGQIGALLDPLLDAWTTTIACASTDEFVILGWLCRRDEKTVAWGYVKPWARGRGVMLALSQDAGVGLGAAFQIAFPVARRLRRLSPLWRPYLVLQ